MSPLQSLLRKTLPLVFLVLAALAHAGDGRTLLVFGDSLSSGYRIDAKASWPALLEKRLQDSGRPVKVVNGSRKGETSEGGRRRLSDFLGKFQPDWVILALGANDGLRRKPLDALAANLRDMITMIRANGATPILVGMKLPPDYDPRYAADFSAVYSDVARQTGTPLVPFLLQDVVGRPDLFMPDHLHPTAEAQGKLLDVVWPVLDSSLSQQIH
ncbi:MAG TPA: arylesterase [Rhodocyclaceae bacterium]|nr:arylesterase [Rhodocyclaceae bacterium]